MRKGVTGNLGGPPDVGPQNPALDRNAKASDTKGPAYEVYSIDDTGRKRRHQLWKDKDKAYNQLKELKRIYGTDLRVGIREVQDMKGHLYQQVVRKCAELLDKAIVTGSGEIKRGKSPKVSGHVSSKLAIGSTKTGKTIHNDPTHPAHESFSSSDHMDAYRAHAKTLTHLDPSETHPSIIAHHKNALNEHYRRGTSMGKGGYMAVVSGCAELLAKAEPKSMVGKTPSGKPIHSNASDNEGFDSDDHMAASKIHEQLARNAEFAVRNAQVQGRGRDARAYRERMMHHDRQAQAHRKASEQGAGRKKQTMFDRINEITGKDRVHVRPTN